VKTAAQWKRYYAAERASLGDVGLLQRLDAAPLVVVPERGALVFPHTMASMTGHFTAAVAEAVLRSGADEVLAIGVLHGGREADADLVRRARAGDLDGRTRLRRVHTADDALCAEEFSLDAFAAFLELASKRAAKKAPRLVARYPFLVGESPGDVPGIEEVTRLASRMPVVATADPMHHGAGYGTPESERRSGQEDATRAWARDCIQRQIELLCEGRWSAFAKLAADARSDFRDAGPALAHALRAAGEPGGEILELQLVDYAEALDAEGPTWVAAALARVSLRP